MIKGLIFDFDGTIVDTETTWYYAFNELYSLFNVRFPLSLWLTNVGSATQRFDPIQYLQHATHYHYKKDELLSLIENLYQNYKRQSGLIPGIKEFIQYASLHNLKLAIASCATQDWVYKHLIDYDLISYFSTILTIEDVCHEKPNPEIYNKVVHQMHFNHREVIAFEDSTHGIMAASSAGLFTIGINNILLQQGKIDACQIILDNYYSSSLDSILLSANSYYRNRN